MDASQNPLADMEAAFMAWHERLAARERDLLKLQANLIEVMGILNRMAVLQAEIAALQRGEPDRSQDGGRPALRLVPTVEKES